MSIIPPLGRRVRDGEPAVLGGRAYRGFDGDTAGRGTGWNDGYQIGAGVGDDRGRGSVEGDLSRVLEIAAHDGDPGSRRTGRWSLGEDPRGHVGGDAPDRVGSGVGEPHRPVRPRGDRGLAAGEPERADVAG